MQQNAPTPNPLERRLDLAIAREALENATEERLKRMGRNVKMPGFRPGKVPFSVLRQQYGAGARHEALSEALQTAFGEAVTTQKLNVAGLPRIEEKESENNETHLAFAAIFEVYPEFTPGDLAEAKIERPVLEVTAAEVDRTIELLRGQRVRYSAVERPAEKDDRVVIDFAGRKDGEPFQGGQASNYPFVLGRGMMLPAFEEAVLGMRADEGKTFAMTFPENYFAKELAGQPVEFDIKVHQVMAPVLPAVDAEFARSLGIEDGDLEKMRAEVEGNLRREVSKRIEARLQGQAMEALLAANPIPVPNVLVETEVRRMMEAQRQHLEARGVKAKDIPFQPAWFAEQAKRRVTLGLIVAEIVRRENLQADKDQVRALVEEIAETYEHPQEAVNWFYANSRQLAEIEGRVMERNVVQWVLSQAKVIDQPITYEALMNQESA